MRNSGHPLGAITFHGKHADARSSTGGMHRVPGRTRVEDRDTHHSGRGARLLHHRDVDRGLNADRFPPSTTWALSPRRLPHPVLRSRSSIAPSPRRGSRPECRSQLWKKTGVFHDMSQKPRKTAIFCVQLRLVETMEKCENSL